MWFEFVRFLRNTSRTFCPTDILSIRHTHTHALYGRRTQLVFLWIFQCNSLQQNTPLLSLTLHQFTRTSNRFNCRMQQTPRNPTASIPLLMNETYHSASITVLTLITTCPYPRHIIVQPSKQKWNCKINILGTDLIEHQRPDAKPISYLLRPQFFK